MDISIDTRTLKKGQWYIPIKGPHFDGKEFIPEALEKGARILDVDLPSYAKKYRKKLRCQVIGVTGSAGKTTIKDMLYYILKQKFNVVRTLENENNEIGTPLTLLRADDTTDILIVEMGMRQKGEIKYLAQIVRPTHVVITSIGMSHVELLKTQRNIACAKAEIFCPKQQWEHHPRYAFLNYNTPYYSLLKKKAEKQGFQLFPFKGQDKVDTNVNLCYTIGRHFGISDEEISQGLAEYQPSHHRLRIHKLGNNITLVDDTYNANPDGVIYALQFIKRFKGRKILVLGDMLELGKDSESEHQKIIQYVIDNEISCLFTYGKESEKMHSDQISIAHFLDKKSLNKQLCDELKSGDILLVKGSRGMKMEETVDYVKQHH